MKYIERFAVVIGVLLLAGTLAVGYERSGAAPTPVLRPAREPSATQPSPVQTSDAGAATHTAGQPPTPRANGRHPRPEEIVRLAAADPGPGRPDRADAGAQVQRRGDPHVALADPGAGAAGTTDTAALRCSPQAP